MRDFVNRTPTTSSGSGGRRPEHSSARPTAYYSHAMARPYGRREAFVVTEIPCVGAGRPSPGRRQRWHRWSTLCCYIAAVVLLQNALMAYNVVRRETVDDRGTIANLTTIVSGATPVAVSPVVRVTQLRTHPAAVKTASSHATGVAAVLPSSETDEKSERMYYRKRPTKVNPYQQQVT